MGPVTGFVLVADDADVTRLGNVVGLQYGPSYSR